MNPVQVEMTAKKLDSLRGGTRYNYASPKLSTFLGFRITIWNHIYTFVTFRLLLVLTEWFRNSTKFTEKDANKFNRKKWGWLSYYLSLYIQTLFWIVIGQQLTGNSDIPSNRHVLSQQQRSLIFILDRTLIQR